MRKSKATLYIIIFITLFILSACATKDEQRLLVYKINNNYYTLEKNCVERISLREDRPAFSRNDNLVIELDNQKECVQLFSKFISSNIGGRIHTLFDGYEIYPATKIVSAIHFSNGLFYQVISERKVALEIVKAYAN